MEQPAQPQQLPPPASFEGEDAGASHWPLHEQAPAFAAAAAAAAAPQQQPGQQLPQLPQRRPRLTVHLPNALAPAPAALSSPRIQAAAEILARSLSLASPRGPPTRGQGPLRIAIPLGQGSGSSGSGNNDGAAAATTPSPRYGGGRRAGSVPVSPSANGARAAKKAPVRWTAEEDERLRAAIKKHGAGSWAEASRAVGTRSHIQCLQRWNRVLRPGLTKGLWTPEEDAALLALVEAGEHTFTDIAIMMGARTSKQCRERWFHHLDPSIKRGGFEPEEDATILRMHGEMGNAWAAMARALPGRTEDAVKSRFKCLARGRARGGKKPPQSPQPPSQQQQQQEQEEQEQQQQERQQTPPAALGGSAAEAWAGQSGGLMTPSGESAFGDGEEMEWFVGEEAAAEEEEDELIRVLIAHMQSEEKEAAAAAQQPQQPQQQPQPQPQPQPQQEYEDSSGYYYYYYPRSTAASLQPQQHHSPAEQAAVVAAAAAAVAPFYDSGYDSGYGRPPLSVPEQQHPQHFHHAPAHVKSELPFGGPPPPAAGLDGISCSGSSSSSGYSYGSRQEPSLAEVPLPQDFMPLNAAPLRRCPSEPLTDVERLDTIFSDDEDGGFVPMGDLPTPCLSPGAAAAAGGQGGGRW